MSTPIALNASIVGSSWKRPETSGLAPMLSPALTTSVLRFCLRSALMCVARYSAPPAGVRTPPGQRDRARGRDVAVEVVDAQQLDVDRPLLVLVVVPGVSLGGRGRDKERGRADETDGA
jgi:hypothetical protein